MKCTISVGAGVVALALLGALGVAEVVLDTSSSLVPSFPWRGNSLSNAPVTLFPGSNAPVSASTPALKTPAQARLLAPSVRRHPPDSPARPAPGVYRTAPYSCIVVVPGPHLDDRFVTTPREGQSSMPIIRPELRFIPLHPPKQ